jgi:hypothetical protein
MGLNGSLGLAPKLLGELLIAVLGKSTLGCRRVALFLYLLRGPSHVNLV